MNHNTMLVFGQIQLDVPIVQAALSGYSDAAMRLLARAYGCPYALNEVVLDRFVSRGGKKMRQMLAIPEGDHPVGGQLMGSEPEHFAVAADEMVSIGYDAVDINFGCPVRKVLGRCRGGYLLSVPDQAREIIRRVCDAVGGRVPVTVKLRRGMDDSTAAERAFFAVLDGAFEIGVAAVTVHGRTVQQRYVGPSDWLFLARVKRHVGDRTVLGSGDLFSAEACVRMLNETGVDGCSVARGAIGNPFIFREARALLAGDPLPPPPSIASQRAAILHHFELMSDLYGDRKASILFRKFAVRYRELHPCGRQAMMDFLQVRTPEQWRAALDRWYTDAGRFPPVRRRSRRRPETLVAAGAT
ncbi:MAG: tRNA dihydrouridine synthase [Phycisphaerae bacterium]